MVSKDNCQGCQCLAISRGTPISGLSKPHFRLRPRNRSFSFKSNPPCNNLPQYCIYKCSFLIGGMNMPSLTVRISKGTRDILRELAAKSGESMQTIIDRAIEEYRRQSFIQKANKAYLALRENPEAWEAELKERREWEATLTDNQSINK